MLLLRAAAGVILITEGVSGLTNVTNPTFSSWTLIMIAIASGISVLIGFLTPVGSIAAALFSVCIASSWLPQNPSNVISPAPGGILVAVIALALAFLGPGAFSVDSRLFGRREIVIPQVSRSPRL